MLELNYFGWSPIFWKAICVLLLSMAYSVALGGLAKTKLVKEGRVVFGIVALVLFGLSVTNAISVSQLHLGWIFSIIGSFVALVFFFGAMVVTSQVITAKNGRVHIKKDSLIYKLLNKLGGLEFDGNYTLCSLSWLGIGAIIGYPLFLLVVNVACVAIAFIMFLLSGGNPVGYFRDLTNFETPYMQQKKIFGNVPACPIMWILLAGLIYLLVDLIIHSTMALHLFLILASILAFVLVMLVLIVIDFKRHTGYSKYEKEQPVTVRVYRKAVVPTVTTAWNVVSLPFILLAVLKKKVCPPIVIDD